MKQRTAAPQQPTVANARACGALGLMIAGTFDFTAFDFTAFDFKGGDSTTATNLSARRLGMRTT